MKLNYINTIIFIFFLLSAHANSDNSINRLSTIEGEEKILLLNKIAGELRNEDPPKALEYARKAVDLSEELSNNQLIVGSRILLGRIQTDLGNISDAIINLQLAKEIAENVNDVDLTAKCYKYIGRNYIIIRENNKALSYLIKADSLFTLINNETELAETTSLIGSAFHAMNDFDQALEYYLKTLEQDKLLKNEKGEASDYHNIGMTYMVKQDYPKAEEYYYKALKIKETLNDKLSTSITLLNIGSLYYYKNEYGQAMKYFQEALEISLEINDRYGIAAATQNIGEIRILENQTNEGLDYVKKSLLISEENDYRNLMVASYSLLYETFHKLGKYNEAFSWLQKYSAIKDSIYNTEKVNQIANLQVVYQVGQKDKEIKILQKEKENQRLIKNTIILASIFLLILLLLGLYNLRIRLKKNREIRKKEKEIYETELTYQDRQLTTHSLNLLQKNRAMEELKRELQNITDIKNPEVKKNIQYIISRINFNLNLDKDWEAFQLYFTKTHKNFYPQLKKDFPDISGAELKLSALIRLGFSIKETASILNISPDSVKTARSRLRKKFNIDMADNLTEFVRKY